MLALVGGRGKCAGSCQARSKDRAISGYITVNYRLQGNAEQITIKMVLRQIKKSMNDKRGTWPRWSSATAYDLVHIMLRVMNIEFSGRGDQSWVFDHGFQLARLVVNNN